MPNYTDRFWAKWDRETQEFHLLEHHLADVGACFEALVDQPTIRARLAYAGCVDALDDAAASRLCVFAALHDIGKVNVGFQTKTWDPDERPRGIGRAGHTSDMVPILEGKDRETLGWFTDALGWEEILDWDNDNGDTACAIFAVSMSHHGEPIDLYSDRQRNTKIWRPSGELNPQEQVRRIGELIRRWFPDAFKKDGQRLPPAPAFQHMFLGLCTLADWIGSDRERFPYRSEPDKPDDLYFENTARPRAQDALKEIGLDIGKQRDAVAAMSAGFSDSARIFDHIPKFAPNPMQEAARDIPLDERLAIIESETGSGKTEAALWRFARLYESERVDSLYFALPTRAAAVQIHNRVKAFVKSAMPDCDTAPLPVLAVPGYVRAGDFDGRHLPNYRVWWEDGFHDGRRWAAESSKRYLAAQIAVGTVDQAMMAALQVRHSHMRAACLSRSLLVIDEVHASDPYMRAIIEALLKAHLGAGGYALLMSATLGSSARRRWLSRSRRAAANDRFPLADAIAAPYPSIAVRDGERERVDGVGTNDRAKSVRVEARPLMGDFAATAKIALDAARAGAKTLIIRNTVGHAIDTQRALESAAAGDGEARATLFGTDGIHAPHHSRFAAPDRRLLDAEVEKALGKSPRRESGIAVVGTQTLEQSLDIDADLLITDLCPMDVLLQRIGRLHRHSANNDKRPDAFQTPRCIVLTPFAGEDLSPLLKKGGQNPNGLGPEGNVYPDLRISQLTLRLIDKSAANGEAWRIPDMNRHLVESATHDEALREFDGMGEDWDELRKNINGERFADDLTARQVIVKRDKTFLEREVRFASGVDVEERIRTRLGDENIEVELDPPPPSPFNGEEIETISIPLRWLDKNDSSELEAVTVTPNKTYGGFEFAIGNRRFAYDRLGLRRL